MTLRLPSQPNYSAVNCHGLGTESTVRLLKVLFTPAETVFLCLVPVCDCHIYLLGDCLKMLLFGSRNCLPEVFLASNYGSAGLESYSES